MRNIGMMGIVLEGKFRDGIRVLRAKSLRKCSGRSLGLRYPKTRVSMSQGTTEEWNGMS